MESCSGSVPGIRSGEAGHAVPVGIAGPHANGVRGRHTHGPRIAETIAGAGLPGRFPHGADEPPVQLVRPVNLLQGLQSVPHGKSPAGGHGRIGPGDFVQATFSSSQDEGEAIVVGALGKGYDLCVLM